MNTTPEWITEVKEDEVFVFGSNEAGRHGAGAAKMAMKFGAKYGQGFGMQGRSFGIPTMNASVTKLLRLEKIREYVNKFFDIASSFSNLKFYVTEVGCGLAGGDVKDIAPMFHQAVNLNNIYLPKSFWKVIDHLDSE